MRLVPASLHRRMLALSLVATALALVVAGFAIGGVLERFVTGTLDDRLGDRLVALSGAVRGDGTIDRATLARFATPDGSRPSWRIDAPGGSVGSPDARLAPVADYARRPRHHGPPPGDPEAMADAGGAPFDGRADDGMRVHGRTMRIATTRGPALLAVAVPRAVIERPVREALAPLALSLIVLGGALALASIVQLRLGLRPLRALGTAVAAVRAGRARQVPADQPTELRPLAAELNALVADNATALGTARASAANLAHGLKTPVATLGLALAEAGRDPDGSLGAQVARIDGIIRHHLARARSGAGTSRATTPLAPVIADLADAIGRIHVDRGVAFRIDVADGLAVAMDANDVAELAGNLLDNAARHARGLVVVAARTEDRRVLLEVRDDGPGIPTAERPRAIEPGVRLDETGDGHGFGLAIVADLAALYGGVLTLRDAAEGGLCATVTLPPAGE